MFELDVVVAVVDGDDGEDVACALAGASNGKHTSRSTRPLASTVIEVPFIILCGCH